MIFFLTFEFFFDHYVERQEEVRASAVMASNNTIAEDTGGNDKSVASGASKISNLQPTKKQKAAKNKTLTGKGTRVPQRNK